MSLPSLNALRAFESVVRNGSFHAAAQALCVTQPAISHQVKNLEEWVGAALLDRSGRVPQLTRRGADLARDLSLAFDSIESACHRARRKPQRDVLVVAAIPSVASCWLIPRLPQFRELHPDVQIRIIYAHHDEPINFSEVDLAFVFARVSPSGEGFSAQRFLSGDSIPVCSPGLLGGRDVADMGAAQFVELGLLHDTDDQGWREWLQKAGLGNPGKLSGTTFEDFNLLRIAALSGQGVALCSLAMIRPDIADGRLIQLSDITVLSEYSYFMTISDRSSGRGPVARSQRAFVEWVMAELATDAG